MKQNKTLAVAVIALITLSLLPVQAASAQTTFTLCEGDFIPLGILDYGTWTYHDSNTHLRGMVAAYQQYMPGSDPRCSGLNTVVSNANWDAYGVGPSWGTFHVVLAEGSPDGWDGTWTGMSYRDGTTTVNVVGHGYGNLEGQHVFVTIEFPGMFLPGIASGYILDPHGE